MGAWLCPFKVESYNLNGWSNANSTTGKTGYYTLSSVNFNGINLKDIRQLEKKLNTTPRKVLGYLTAEEVVNKCLENQS